jgi:WD40 repeat protein
MDRYGDPLPPGALTRLGTVHYRFSTAGQAFLPDGKTIVSAEQGNAIVFWDARTGRRLRDIDTGRFSIGMSMGRSVAYARDTRRMAVSGSVHDDGKPGWRAAVRVWDTGSGKVVRTFERSPREGVNAVALTRDGKLLLSLGRDGKLRVEEVETGVELLRQQFPGDVGAALSLSADGSTIAVASGPNTHKLLLWKWQAAEEPREIKAGWHRGRDLAFSPDGKWLAECSDADPTVRVYAVDSGRLLHKLELPDYEPYRHYYVAFSPDGKRLAAYGGTNDQAAVNLWDPGTGKFLKRLDMGGGALAFSPDGTLLAAGSHVWDFKAGKELSANDEAHCGAVEHVLTTGKDVVVTASADKTIRIWDAASGRQQRRLVLGGWVRDLALSPDGTRLVSNSLGDDAVCLWDVGTGRKIYRLAGHGQLGGRRAVAFMPDGRSFLSWGDDMYLRKWDVQTGKAVFEHAIRPTGIKILGEEAEPHQREILFGVREGRLTPDGKHLVVHAGGSFFVFDCATGKELHKFPSEATFLIGSDISPDGKLLLASAWGKPVLIKLADGRMVSAAVRNHRVTWWDLTTGRQRHQIMLPEEGAGPVAFSPDGRRFAVASSRPGSHIRIMEVASGREAYHIEGFRSVVRSLAFLPDGQRLVSGMEDSTALVWDLTRKR